MTQELKGICEPILHEELYAISLPDYSLPGFVSGEKLYFGTLADLEELRKSAPEGDQHRFALENLKKGKVIRWEPVEADPWRQVHRVEHRNIYGFPYYMSCDCLRCLLLWLQIDGKYYRCFRGSFENLTYSTEAKGELKPVPASCWGYPGIIRHDGPYTYNRIFVHENTFDSNDEVWIDIGDSMSYDINPTEFFNDIFGDG